MEASCCTIMSGSGEPGNMAPGLRSAARRFVSRFYRRLNSVKSRIVVWLSLSTLLIDPETEDAAGEAVVIGFEHVMLNIPCMGTLCTTGLFWLCSVMVLGYSAHRR